MKKSIISFIALSFFGMTMAQVGIGRPDPKVNLDARRTGNSAIGIGNTNQTASNAEAGAMKYDPTLKKLMYSDGINWVEVAGSQPNAFIPKVLASGRSTATQTVGAGGIYRVWTFAGVLANDGNWNTTTNAYTIPVSGFYQLSMAGGIQASKNINDSDWRIELNKSGTLTYYSLMEVSDLGAAFMANKGGTIVVYLTAGTIISFGSRHCQGCNIPSETYLIDTGATFSVVLLGS